MTQYKPSDDHWQSRLAAIEGRPEPEPEDDHQFLIRNKYTGDFLVHEMPGLFWSDDIDMATRYNDEDPDRLPGNGEYVSTEEYT